MPDLICERCGATFYAEYALDHCGRCERELKAEHDEAHDLADDAGSSMEAGLDD